MDRITLDSSTFISDFDINIFDVLHFLCTFTYTIWISVICYIIIPGYVFAFFIRLGEYLFDTSNYIHRRRLKRNQFCTDLLLNVLFILHPSVLVIVQRIFYLVLTGNALAYEFERYFGMSFMQLLAGITMYGVVVLYFVQDVLRDMIGQMFLLAIARLRSGMIISLPNKDPRPLKIIEIQLMFTKVVQVKLPKHLRKKEQEEKTNGFSRKQQYFPGDETDSGSGIEEDEEGGTVNNNSTTDPEENEEDEIEQIPNYDLWKAHRCIVYDPRQHKKKRETFKLHNLICFGSFLNNEVGRDEEEFDQHKVITTNKKKDKTKKQNKGYPFATKDRLSIKIEDQPDQ
jgi:hypothetical protein